MCQTDLQFAWPKKKFDVFLLYSIENFIWIIFCLKFCWSALRVWDTLHLLEKDTYILTLSYSCLHVLPMIVEWHYVVCSLKVWFTVNLSWLRKFVVCLLSVSDGNLIIYFRVIKRFGALLCHFCTITNNPKPNGFQYF